MSRARPVDEYDSVYDGSGRSRDAWDDLMDSLKWEGSPVLKLKASYRLRRPEAPRRGRLGVSLCSLPWSGIEIDHTAPRYWLDLQYKPPRNGFVQSLRASSRDGSVKMFSAPRSLPGPLDMFRAQIAVGMATVQNGRSGEPHFIARWIIKPRHSGNASYKQQMGGRGVFIRNSFDTAVTFPELQGGVGLGQQPESRDFYGRVTWDCVQLRFHLNNGPQPATHRPPAAPAQPVEPDPGALEPGSRPLTLLERLQSRREARKARNAPEPQPPCAAEADVSEAMSGPRNLLRKLNFQRWRSAALLPSTL